MKASTKKRGKCQSQVRKSLIRFILFPSLSLSLSLSFTFSCCLPLLFHCTENFGGFCHVFFASCTLSFRTVYFILNTHQLSYTCECAQQIGYKICSLWPCLSFLNWRIYTMKASFYPTAKGKATAIGSSSSSPACTLIYTHIHIYTHNAKPPKTHFA